MRIGIVGGGIAGLATAGVVVLALTVSGYQSSDDHHIPMWVLVMSAVVISMGTYSGGWRIMRTLGRRIIHLDPPQGFAAELIDRFGALPREVNTLLLVIRIKAMAKRANISRLDAGPKGATVQFHMDKFPNPAGLVEFLNEQRGAARISDNKLVVSSPWPSETDRIKGAFAIARDLAAKAKAKQTAGEAQGQAQAVAQDAKSKAQDLAGTAQHEAGQVKDEAVQQVKSLAGSVQEQVGSQARTQQERLAGQARTYTDDLHRLVSGEQPQSDLLRQGVASVADRAESLTQRLENASPQDLLQDVRGFAARRPGTFLAIALGAGLLAGRLTRGMRDAGQPDSASQSDGRRREGVRPEAVHADVTPHHLQSQAPAYSSDSLSQADGRVADGAGPRRAAGVGDVPYGTQAPVQQGLTAERPFDQTRPGGDA